MLIWEMYRSALAEAELEYNEQHVSRSIHVRFPITGLCKITGNVLISSTCSLLLLLASALEQKWQDMGDIYAVIWTTTAWTLPANKVSGTTMWHEEIHITYAVICRQFQSTQL